MRNSKKKETEDKLEPLINLETELNNMSSLVGDNLSEIIVDDIELLTNG